MSDSNAEKSESFFQQPKSIKSNLNAFLEAVRDLLSSNDSKEVLKRLASRAHRLLSRNTTAVFLASEDPMNMKIAAVEGRFTKEIGNMVIEMGSGILGSIAKNGRGEIVNNTLHDKRGIPIDGTPETEENEKLMGVPLISDGTTIGIMAIWRDTDEPDFISSDLLFIEALSNLAVIAIENARYYEGAELRIKRLSTLTEISRILVSTRDPETLLETVYQQMSKFFDTTNFYVATYVQGSSEWIWALHYENGVRQPIERHVLGAGLTGYIITNRLPVLLASEAEIRSFLEGRGVKGLGDLPQSWMGVPLVAGDEVTGVMAIQNYKKPASYSETDLDFFALIGTSIAVALQNARLFEDAHEARIAAEDAKNLERQELEREKKEHLLSERLRMELQSSLQKLQNTQEQLVISEKLAVLGGLVSGITHEINTPVGVALTAVTFLGEQTQDLLKALASAKSVIPDDIGQIIENIQESVDITSRNLERAANLISSFKQVSADQTSEARRQFKLDEYIKEIVQNLRHQFKKMNIEITVDCPDDLFIDSYPGAYSQILTNFIINSVKHGFKDRSSDCTISIIASVLEGDTLHLEYADNGTGMSSDNLKHLFEPFYTTSRDKDGTGLGTTIAYSLVTQRLGGTIEAESEEGKGLRYTMTVPLNRQEKEV